MSGCRVKLHLCFSEKNEIRKWDVECDEQQFQLTDTFAQVRSLVSSGALSRKFEPSVQERISTMLSKGIRHGRMYVIAPIMAGNSSIAPLEVTDEDLSVRHSSWYDQI